MSFEEDFPSLKDKSEMSGDGCANCAIEYGGNHNFEEYKVFTIEDIQKHCLDKQRTKEAINKLMEDENYGYAGIDGNELMKELDLEDEK